MKTTKPVDLALFSQELTAAQVPHNGVGLHGTNNPELPDEIDLFTYGEDGFWIDLPSEAQPVLDAHDASKTPRAKAFERQEDVERIALVQARAEEDPAFAALAELTLGKQPGGAP